MAAYQWPLWRTSLQSEIKWLKETRVLYFWTDVAHRIYRTSPPVPIWLLVRNQFSSRNFALSPFFQRNTRTGKHLLKIDAKRVIAKISSFLQHGVNLRIIEHSTTLISWIPSSAYKLLAKKEKLSSPLVIWLVCGKIAAIHLNCNLTRTLYTTHLK